MPRILVTGGAGYIGSGLVPQLLEWGCDVVVFDNLMYGGAGLLGCSGNPRFELRRGDVRDRKELADAAKGCDVLIHLAAIVGAPACAKDPYLARDVNCNGAKTVADVAGRDRLVLLGSTGSNYGAVPDGICTEETDLNPVSLYGETKVFAERHIRDHCTAIAYRFATAFGLSPRLRLDLLVNDFVFRALRDGYLVVYEPTFMRTFIHVEDMARSFLFAINHADEMVGNVYNVGSDAMNFTKAEVCEMIRAELIANGRFCQIIYADVGEDADKRDYQVSYERITKMGFSTTIDLQGGIGSLVRGLQLVAPPSFCSNA
jgi:nucleoside-diphosphate-sugar epimerase